MEKRLRILAIVGPLGAGKTTLGQRIIKGLHEAGVPTKEHVAYLINDEGALIDGELAGNNAKVVTMTNGCFTCSDTSELRETLRMLESSTVEWVLLEGFGITSGTETAEFLASCPYPFDILCVLDARHHAANLVRYSDVVASHVRSSTLGVVITKQENAASDEHILEFIGGARPGTRAMFLSEEGALPDEIMQVFTSQQHSSRRFSLRATQPHDEGCECCHDHAKNSSVHGMFTYSLQLKDGVTFQDVRRAFADCPSILRVKGAVDGKLFNEVHGEWKQTVPDQRQFVTFYASHELSLEKGLPYLATITRPEAAAKATEQSYQLLRNETVSREQTVEAIKALLQNFPEGPILLKGAGGMRLITHPEILQLAKEVSRRPSVKDEWFPIVLKRCMEYWLACTDVLLEHKTDIDTHQLPTNQRELGVSLSWWVTRFPEHFGTTITSATERARPGSMAAYGALALSSLNADPERAYWQCKELAEAFSYGIAHGDDRDVISQAARHCQSISPTPQLTDLWSETVSSLARQ